MQEKYTGLAELINADREAKNYFNALPDYVRRQIFTRSSGVNSFASLQDYAENLLRGDDWNILKTNRCFPNMKAIGLI